MRLAYLILAHSNAGQLKRLVNSLLYVGSDIYIHIDKKIPIGPFLELANIPTVVFIEQRVKVYWGAFSIVQATINGFKAILASKKEYAFVHLLSGQDYPIRPLSYMHQFLKANVGKAFMEYYDVHTVWKEAIPRLQQYHLTDFNFAGSHLLQKWMNKLLPVRTLPNKLVAVGRSQWFTISCEHVRYIVHYLDENPKVLRFFKFTWGADELVFQTILFNSPYQKDMVNDNLRYIDWSGGGASPKTFTVLDAPFIFGSQRFFARKFSADPNDPLLQLIDDSNEQ